MKQVIMGMLVAAAGSFAFVVGYAVAGQRGIVAALSVLAIGGLLVVVSIMPSSRHAAPAGRRRAARARATPMDFPSYRTIESALLWAETSRRHYDHAVRPVLTHLLSRTLADHRRIDLARQPEAARQLVGEELWPLVDPTRPISHDSSAPGVDAATLSKIVSLLEDL